MRLDSSPKPIIIKEYIGEHPGVYITEKGISGIMAQPFYTVENAMAAIRNGAIKFRNGQTVEEEDVEAVRTL